MEDATPKTERFKEIFAIMDDQSWIWNLVRSCLEKASHDYVRLPSSVPIRDSWNRFCDGARIIVHWEAKGRSGGAIIEEILDVEPNFNVGDRIITLVQNPTHEDVVYFSELGVRRIIKIRNRQADLEKSVDELNHHLSKSSEREKYEQAWQQILHTLDTLEKEASEEKLLHAACI